MSDYIRSRNDTDWYSLNLPTSLTARSLVHITARYTAPSTPVHLSLLVLKDDGVTSLGQRVDGHTQGTPQPLDLLLRPPSGATRVLLFFSDKPGLNGTPNFDPRNSFGFTAEILNDPNPNDPGTTAAITLSNQGGVLAGSQFGYLITDNEIRKFSANVDASGGRTILYLNVTETAGAPPPPYRLAYSLTDPAGNPVSQDHVANPFLDANLATARLATSGNYIISIFGFKPADSVDPVPGDITKRFTVAVKVMPDVDANEPNDVYTSPTLTSWSTTNSGASQVGRLSYVPDNDWFAFDLASNPNPTLLHFRLTPLGAGGRFPALLIGATRELLNLTPVTAGGPQACVNDPTVCPKGYPTDPNTIVLVGNFCQNYTPPLCLMAMRDEAFAFQDLRNFEGMVHVPPHATTIRYLIDVHYLGDNSADDLDYRLDVQWLDDPDEASLYSGGVKQTTVRPFYHDLTGSTFPTPPPGANQFTGALSYGYGRTLRFNPNQGQGVRGPTDYDAIITDIDTYELDFPGGLSPPLDQSWELQFKVNKLSDGGTPYDLALELLFCNGDATPTDGGSCAVVSQGSRGGPLVLSYTPSSLTSWWNTSVPLQPIYDKAGDNTVTARAYGCFCFEPRFVRGGKFFFNVAAVDRTSYDRSQYTVTTAFTNYPQSFDGGVDGGVISCPPVSDGGCQFSHEL